jgi:hypothetical protein
LALDHYDVLNAANLKSLDGAQAQRRCAHAVTCGNLKTL